MLDKFTIGPVTIVQLVGLTAKPRLTSAQADGAVRAADLIPPSAAAGFGDSLSHQVGEIEASSFDLRAAPAFGLLADPVRGKISLESGADRSAVEANAPAPAIGPSDFDLIVPDDGLVAPNVSGRVAPPAPVIPANLDVKDATPPAAPDDGREPGVDADLGYIFDGIEGLGDD